MYLLRLKLVFDMMFKAIISPFQASFKSLQDIFFFFYCSLNRTQFLPEEEDKNTTQNKNTSRALKCKGQNWVELKHGQDTLCNSDYCFTERVISRIQLKFQTGESESPLRQKLVDWTLSSWSKALCLKPCVGPGKGREECKSADGCSRLGGRSGHREGRI